MNIDFTNQVAIVTGGAQGIGAATVELLCELNARVAIFDRDEEQANLLVERLATRGLTASFHRCDVCDPAAVQRATAAAVQHYGAIHVLVHSAGIQRYGDVISTSMEIWRETLAVHVDGCFHTAHFVLPHMVAAGGGSVVIVGSVQTVTAVAGSAAYVTAKHALAGLTRSIALDFAKHNVRANCVMPGAVDTPMLRSSANLAPIPNKCSTAVHEHTRLGVSPSRLRLPARLPFLRVIGHRLSPEPHWRWMEECWCPPEAWVFRRVEQDR